jgi:HD-GYP domain-containing protein (c-di-GMP phosphodiesterase class II)
LLHYQLARGASGSIAFIPFLTTVVLVPSWIAVLAVAGAVTIVECLVKRSTMKAVFNVGQHALGAALAVWVFREVGGGPLMSRGSFTAVPLLLASLTFMATNSLAVSIVIALSERREVFQVWRANTLGTLGYDLLALPVVYGFAKVYVTFGVTGAVALAVPLLGVRQLYKTNWLLETTNRELLELMVAAIEARDPYTSGHSRRVAKYARLIARAYNLSLKEVERISIAALLHDVGKIHEVFAPILRKPGRLSPEERAVMETHPEKSHDLIKTVSHLQDILPSVLHHHENWDGTGYPCGLSGDSIPLGARVIRFADTIDAMTSDRPYRAALSKKEVRAELIRFRGSQFDPELCDALLRSPQFDLLFAPPSRVTPLHSPALTWRSKRIANA